MQQDPSSQFLQQLKTLTDSLGLVPKGTLPESFENDILSPLQTDPCRLDRLGDRFVLFALLNQLGQLGSQAGSRKWFFWEKALSQLAEFVAADRAVLGMADQRGNLTYLFPQEFDEAAVEVFPNLGEGALAPFDWDGSVQGYRFLIGLGPHIRFLLGFVSKKTFPLINQNRLRLVMESGPLVGHLFRPHIPQIEAVADLDVIAIGDDPMVDDKIIGKDSVFLHALNALAQAANSDACVYLKGESGTGKELFARRLHELSPRGNGPFVPINCSAIPHELIESEMFGHEKGAFTGAYFRKIGKAEQANDGTLFLDEIGEMPLAFQAKLLRFLQEKQFTRVGGNRQVESNTRIVVATHRDLSEMVAAGKFREDLYYRVHVIPILIPPLRARHGDIRIIAEHLFKKYIEKSRASRRKVNEYVFDILERYAFPGNVRELDNLIQRTVVMTQKPVIGPEDLPGELLDQQAPSLVQSFKLHPFEKLDQFIPSDRDSLRELKKEVEYIAYTYGRDLDRRFLMHQLAMSNGSARKAAELAGINRTLFYKMMKKAGIEIGSVAVKEDGV